MEIRSYSFTDVDGVIFFNRTPNLVTLIGLLSNMITFCLAAWNSDYFSVDCPNWIFFLMSVSMFFYQTMDAIDGKQARRTNSSSPLGELFDHTCDSVNFIMISLMLAAMLGARIDNILFCTMFQLSALAFCTATFETFHTGTLYLGMVNGPVEGCLLFCLNGIISGIYGVQIWRQQFFGYSLNYLIIILYNIFTLFTIGLRYWFLI